MAPIVRFRSAVSLLGRFPALAGVDLDVAPGEVVLLHGPNGAGKTTLLRACAGLVAITSGQAEVLGHDLCRDRRAVRRRVGLLGHAAGLYGDLTVDDNLRFAARAAGRPADAAEEAMGRLGLDGRLRHVAVGRLSAGQRRRAAIAAVIARRPELWLLDEPHAGLDAAGRDLLDAIVAESVAGGASVLMASHELERASSLAGRRVAVAGGRVVGGLMAGAAAEPGPGPAVTSTPVPAVEANARAGVVA
jgi:heme ABC exporter ATP-binding subunit CcmA